MSQVIPFPNERSPSRCGTDGVPETFGPPRDFGWLLYSIIEIEIAQASLANAISRLPPDSLRSRLQVDHADLKRQMKLVRLAIEDLMRTRATAPAEQLSP